MVGKRIRTNSKMIEQLIDDLKLHLAKWPKSRFADNDAFAKWLTRLQDIILQYENY